LGGGSTRLTSYQRLISSGRRARRVIRYGGRGKKNAAALSPLIPEGESRRRVGDMEDPSEAKREQRAATEREREYEESMG